MTRPAAAAGNGSGHVPLTDAERARALDALGQAVVVSDLAGVVTYWNDRATELYGYQAAEALGRPVYELIVAPVAQDLAADVMAALAAGRPWTGVFPVRRKDGSTFIALVTDSGQHDATGRLIGVVGTSVNIGEVLRPYLAHSSEAAVVVTRGGQLLYASPAIEPVFGWGFDELLGRPFADLVVSEDLPALMEALRGATAAASSTVELRLHRSDGSEVWVEARCTDLTGDPTIGGVLCTLRDVGERHEVLDRLAALATTDPLTGLPNRSVLAERLAHAASRRDRRGAVVFVDMDDFKGINDRHGHETGDAVLTAVADRLRHGVRPEDTCGRWAGDEFLVLAEQVSRPEEAEELVRRLRGLIEQSVVVGGVEVVPRASLGFSLVADAPDDAEGLVRAADQAMYDVKRSRSTSRHIRLV